MCMGSKVPGPPPAVQEVKEPDTNQLKRKRPAGVGTVLTGPAGAGPSTMNTGGTTLLGG